MGAENITIVKSWNANTGEVVYYKSLASCVEYNRLKHNKLLQKLIESGGIGPDGKTFFDLPTDLEMKLIKKGEILLV